MKMAIYSPALHRARPIQSEARRVLVVRWIFLLFLLSLIEGVLRKWLLPGLASPLTVMRDPLVIALYGYCLSHGLMLRRGIAEYWLTFAMISGAFGLVQYAMQSLPLWGWALGVRTYWLYMPLAFVVAKSFRTEDVHRLMKLVLWISIPYAFLVAAQYGSPPNAFLNRGVGGDDEGAVGVALGIVRPFGLFTFTGPNVQYTAFSIAMFLAFYVGGVPMKRRGLFLLATGSAIGAMSVLTGSRSIYFLAGFTVVATVFGMLAARPSGHSLKRALGVIGFVLLAAFLFIYAFPDMLLAMENRFQRAAGTEGSIWGRAFGGLFSWLDPLFTAPWFGFGIGAGAPGVARMLGLPALIYGESDLQRNVNELGLLLGIPMLALRLGTAAFCLSLAFRLAKRQVFAALPIAGFVFLPYFMGQITHSPIIGFLVWLGFGVLIGFGKRIG